MAKPIHRREVQQESLFDAYGMVASAPLSHHCKYCSATIVSIAQPLLYGLIGLIFLGLCLFKSAKKLSFIKRASTHKPIKL